MNKKRTYFASLMFLCATLFGGQEVPRQLQKAFIEGNGVDFIFFMPDQRKEYKDEFLWACYHTRGTIKAALYRLTDRDVANALVAAHVRGVIVEVVLDPGAINSAYSLASLLFKAGITVYRYQPTGLLPPFPKTFPTIMHHKTFIFTDINGHELVVWGSLNPTNAGFNGNEEVNQMSNKHVAAFKNHFEMLKKRSVAITAEIFKKPSVIKKLGKMAKIIK